MKKMNKKGFTLAELLIVVAIIAVLVAIAIPIFKAQLDKSKAATDQANARSLYAVLVADFLDDGEYEESSVTAPTGDGKTTYNGNTFKWSDVLTAGSINLDETNGPSVSITTNGSTYNWPETAGT